MLNDTLEYDDDFICGAMGIFRMQNIKEPLTSNQLITFPNPSSGIVQLIFHGLTGNEILVEVFDFLGKLVLSKNKLAQSNTLQLSLSDYNSGLYNVKLSDRLGNHITGKILLNK
ncbi:MAG: T9SS type A sorting domain-containing protein [Bacteroidetes bacterium]|nr:T9SS type A sorting domain-containing protein [Bacteroidota bacterium]